MSKIDCKCDWCGKPLKRLDNHQGKEIKNHFCDKACKGKWQKKQREDLGYTKEWLYQEYVVKQRTANDIAKEVGRDPKRVWEWLRDYGIETRKRGYGNPEVHFKKGEQSRFKGHKHTEENKEKQRERRMIDGRVPYLVDGKHWLKQEGKHPSSWKGGVTPERQAIYSSIEWKEAVKEVWQRDKAICRLCGVKKKENRDKRFDIHHLYSFAEYKHLRTNADNLVLLCKDCHIFVHSKNNIENKFMVKDVILPNWIERREEIGK